MKFFLGLILTFNVATSLASERRVIRIQTPKPQHSEIKGHTFTVDQVISVSNVSNCDAIIDEIRNKMFMPFTLNGVFGTGYVMCSRDAKSVFINYTVEPITEEAVPLLEQMIAGLDGTIVYNQAIPIYRVDHFSAMSQVKAYDGAILFNGFTNIQNSFPTFFDVVAFDNAQGDSFDGGSVKDLLAYLTGILSANDLASLQSLLPASSYLTHEIEFKALTTKGNKVSVVGGYHLRDCRSSGAPCT